MDMKVAFKRFVAQDIGEINLSPALAEGNRDQQQIHNKDR
jgi:hypothetical protein